MLIVPGDDPCSDVVADLGDHDGTSMTWMVNLPAGTNVMISLEDGNGDEAWSGAMVVGPSNDSSCLPAASSAVSSTPDAVSSTPDAVSSSRSSDTQGSSTLYVPPVATEASPTPAPSSSGGAVAVGAANAGDNPLSNGAFSFRQFSIPAMVLSAAAAVFVLA